MGPRNRALYNLERMSSFASRLKKARAAKGISQERLAKIVGIEQPSVAAMESGKAAGTKHISAIARALDQDVSWLSENIGSFREPGSTPARRGYEGPSLVQVEGDAYARLPLYDIRAQAGKGALAYDGEPIGWRVFDLNWLKAATRAPIEQLKVIEVAGDSMEPTLYKGDHVLVDLTNQAIAQPGLFVLRLDDSLMVKRVQKLLRSGGVRVISDNPRYEPEEIADEGQLVILGRVIWLGRGV